MKVTKYSLCVGSLLVIVGWFGGEQVALSSTW